MYAVKTIRCQMGKEVAANAVREAIITDRFQHPNIIKIVVRFIKPCAVWIHIHFFSLRRICV